MNKPTIPNATCPGKLLTFNVPLQTLILDRHHVAMMVFLIVQKSIKFTISLYTPHKEIRAKLFHADGPRVVMGIVMGVN